MPFDSKTSPVTYFAQTDSRGRRIPFGIKARDRSRHMYIIGKTGMGKSTLLENMAIQDIRNGNGVAFIDPHGKTADLLLDYVPESRVKDVLYFAPFDMEHPVSFNIMEDVGPDRRHLVVNGLMATFEKIWVDAWSARMAYILQNTLLALLEYPGSTLLGVNRMLVDKEYRRQVVTNITDPSVRAFWVDEFAKYTDRYTQEATPAIQNKVGQFTANPLIRNIVGQPTSTFNLRQMMDEKRIVIMNLSKGKVGEGNVNLLGSMLITKIYLAAMSRADVTERELQKLPDFFLYVDEFQSFANKSFADILSEARKYKLNLTLAHQYIEQMEEEVSAAVFGNVGTMAVFRVGAFDAEVLEKEFMPAITAEDLVNLGIYQIYLKLMIDGVTSPPFSAVTLPPIERPAVSFREAVIEHSRKTFGHARAAVEEEIKRWHAPIAPPPKAVVGVSAVPSRLPAPVRLPLRREAQAGGQLDETVRAETSRAQPSLRAGSAFPRRFDAQSRAGERREPSYTSPVSQKTPPHTNFGEVSVGARPQMPLSALRPAQKQERAAPAHLSDLRKALSDVLQAEKEETPRLSNLASPFGKGELPSSARRSEDENLGNKRVSVGPKEIPEILLRQLLEVKEETPAEKPITPNQPPR